MYNIYQTGSDGKASACNARHLCSIPGSVRYPWRRAWLPTPVFLPGESHGQRSLAGYCPWGHKELDMTKQLTHKHISQPLVLFLPPHTHKVTGYSPWVHKELDMTERLTHRHPG